MKVKIFKPLLIVIALILILLGCFELSRERQVNAQSQACVIRPAESSILFDDEYLSVYRIPSTFFTYSSNGGSVENYALANAFDNNYSTYYLSQVSNGENYLGVDNIVNTIKVEFNSVVNIDKFVFKNCGCLAAGYPSVLKFYYSDGESEYQLLDTFDSIATVNKVCFNLSSKIDCKKVKLEFCSIFKDGQANVGEIQFYQSENESANKLFSLFSDYCQTKLNSEFNSSEALNSLKEKLQTNANYNTTIVGKILKAEQILADNHIKHSSREFSPSLSGINKLYRYGDIRSYALNTLKMVWAGTNRQVTGIYSTPGEVITVYVDCEDGDSLPKIVFTQHQGGWRSWKSGEITLKKGANILTTPTFDQSSYSSAVTPGGPIYLVNPYTNQTQSDNVKVYIEGGKEFPVYRLGDSEITYKNKLAEFVRQYGENSSSIINVTELVSDFTIMTLPATLAHEVYQTKSPNQNLKNWDEYMQKIYAFDGVQFDSKDEYYDERNNHININFRLAQPYGAAYAYTEHIGIFGEDWLRSTLYSEGVGWGFTHEIGHMIDMSERVVSECSNNMVSKYNETAIEKIATRGDFDITTKCLSSDRVKNSERCFNTSTSEYETYFNHNRGNFLIWWLIESYFPGYWGRMENLYRYNNISSLNATEKQVYFSSLATGIDLSYYFERWGYNLSTSDDVFEYTNASDNFKLLLNSAISEGKISNKTQPKLWYLDAKQYNLISTESGIYNSTITPAIESVAKVSSGYSIVLNNSILSSHLGYEILEGNDIDGYKVIGFTNSNIFIDENVYAEGYTPSYKIVGYDRKLNTTNLSEKKSPRINENVCRIGSVYYTSLSNAVLYAQNGDIIYLCEDITEGKIIIDKNITIKVDTNIQKNLSINRADFGDLFTVLSGCSLVIQGNESSKIVINGASIKQGGALIASAGTLELSNVVFIDSYSSSNGGAILLKGGAFEAVDCEFRNNNSNMGGAICVTSASVSGQFTRVNFFYNEAVSYGGAVRNNGTLVFNDCEFGFNSSSGYGGAVSNDAGGVVTFNNCDFVFNSAENGGALYLDGRTIISNSTIKDNIASKNGGGIYFSASNSARFLTINNSSEVSTNVANNGGAVYCLKGKFEVINSTLNLNVANNTLYVASGDVVIDGATLDGYFYKAALANITIKDNMFIVDKSMAFDIEKTIFPITLLNIYGFTLSDEQLDIIKVCSSEIGVAELSEDGQSVNLKPFVVFTICIGEEQKQIKVVVNEKLKINSIEVDEKSYISKVVDENNNIYNLQDEILATNDMTLYLTLEAKKVVVLDYLDVSIKKYLVPGERFTLPERNALSQLNVLRWKYGAEYLSPGQEVIVNEDRTFTAEYENYVLFTFVCNNAAVSKKLYEIGSLVQLTQQPVSREGYRFNGWKSNGEIYNINDSITVVDSMTFTADYVRQYSITYMVGKEVYKVIYYDENSEIELYGKDDNGLRKYNRWRFELIELKFGEKIVVDEDMTLYAIEKKTALIVAVCVICAALIAVVVYFVIKEKRETGKVDIIGNIFK